MKKTFIMLGTLSVVFLMVSIATAVPQTQSRPVMEAIQSLEDAEQKLDNTTLHELLNPQSTGFFDKLFEFIKLLIQLIMNIATIVQSVLSIIALIKAIFSAIQLVMQLIQQIIELFQDPARQIA